MILENQQILEKEEINSGYNEREFVALAIEGKAISVKKSLVRSGWMRRCVLSDITFVIGGSLGLSRSKKRNRLLT